MTIQDFTKHELQAELARREAEEKTKPPPILAQPNFQDLQTAVVEYVGFVAQMGNTLPDHGISKEIIYEAALESIYGKDILFWIGRRMARDL
jgi:hypothetical protein